MLKKLLLENTDAFIALVEKIQEGVILHYEDTSIIYVNSSASKMLGLTKDELLGKTATNHEWYFIDENHKKLPLSEYPVNKLFRTKKNIQHMLLGVFSKSESLRWIDLNASITFTKDKKPMALVVLNDITNRKDAYEELELFKKLVEIADTGITISDPSLEDNPLIYANKTFSEITGYQSDEVIGKNCRYLQAEDRQQDGAQIIKDAIKSEEASEVVLRNYKKDGTLFYNLLNIAPYFEQDRLKYFIGVQHDITKQVEQEKKLEEQALYIQSILDAQENMVLVSNGSIASYANRTLLDFFEVETIEVFLKKYSCVCNTFIKDDDYFHLGKVPKDKSWVEIVEQNSPHKKVVVIEDKKDEKRYFRIDVQSIKDALYVITLVDITVSLFKELALQNKAYHDPLTELYNRQYFYEYIIHQSTKSELTTGIIMTDIDNFKSINDTYGHGVGDLVLQRVAKTIKNSLREKDDIIRWGGEEFVIVITVKSLDEVSTIAENLRAKIEAISLENVRKLTASFGATILQKDENIDSAIERSDRGLYLAKEKGKNRVEILMD